MKVTKISDQRIMNKWHKKIINNSNIEVLISQNIITIKMKNLKNGKGNVKSIYHNNKN